MKQVCLVFGDQLDRGSPVYDTLEPSESALLMVEARAEGEREWSHPQRIVLFLSAMRHFAADMRERGFEVDYLELGEAGSLEEGFSVLLARHAPETITARRPGDYRALELVRRLAEVHGCTLSLHEDDRALCPPEVFAEYARGRGALRMEYFYRFMRRRHDLLMDGDKPAGGAWNFDKDNRGTFGKQGPPDISEAPQFPPDETTQAVMQAVARYFPEAPGELESFCWPVTPDDAEELFGRFLHERLPRFGEYQDAMWSGSPLLFHSGISASLNLGLLDPLDVVRRVEAEYSSGRAPLNSVEGFIRQVLGWREFVRGIYWLKMPGYLEHNELGADRPLPRFFWTGETDMHCVSDTVSGLRARGYAHHIQRLMVTGLFALLYGVNPRAVHDWYMGMYVDSVEWVTAANTIGMSQYADGGVVASKPYAAGGKYNRRMSNYCGSCRFNPELAVGDNACPFTTLYWDFLLRHRERLSANTRMKLQVRNLDRFSSEHTEAITRQAECLRGETERGDGA
ncbi:MAG: cryptochrome/photolyase family protein [Spirochaetia bacterium]